MSWQSLQPEALLAISEVAARTGLSPRTIRYYEELGLLPGVRRREGGRRVYGPDELERLRVAVRNLIGVQEELRDFPLDPDEQPLVVFWRG